MANGYIRWAIFSFCFVLLKPVSCSEEVLFNRRADSYFDGYVISAERADSEIECGIHCTRQMSCASANFKVRGENKGLCELSSKAVEDLPANRIKNTEFVYLGLIERKCPEPGQVFSKRKKKCFSFKSCKEVLEENRDAKDGVYKLFGSSQQYDAYCHMSQIPGCGNERETGWTLVMKVDGNKQTFTYDSSHWTDKKSYAVENGLEGLTEKESKLASYWNTPFKKICLGMTIDSKRDFMMLDYEASSLYHLIADGHNRNTTAGYKQWKLLIQSSQKKLLEYCVTEGFNIKHGSFFARVGFGSNERLECDRVGTALALGIQFRNDRLANNNELAAGYVVSLEEHSETKAFAYILVS